eukprot:scaffold119_cov66-Skeletonema_marinoi.AAC.3
MYRSGVRSEPLFPFSQLLFKPILNSDVVGNPFLIRRKRELHSHFFDPSVPSSAARKVGVDLTSLVDQIGGHIISRALLVSYTLSEELSSHRVCFY